MSGAQPGWYAAGVPGRERWWDGTQWTAHERDAAPQPPAVPVAQPAGYAVAPPAGYAATPPASHAVAQPASYAVAQPAGPAVGWYVVTETGQTRWWSGSYWSGHYLKDGRVTSDAVAVEPPAVGWMLGISFAGVGLMNVLRASTEPWYLVVAVVFLASAVWWFVGSARSGARRKMPAPLTAPVVDDSLRPFPGEAEGPGAGWYPVAGATLRWWTGTRWAEYVSEKGLLRPTQGGAAIYRALNIVVLVVGALGLISLVTGIVMAAVSGSSWPGAGAIVIGVVCLLMSGLIWLVFHLRRYALLLPPHPPSAPAQR